MIVDEIRHQCGSERCELSARVRSEAWAREEFTLWYRMPAALLPDHDPTSPDASPFLVALLLWCLRRGEALSIDGRVSSRLLGNVALATDVCRSFWPELISPVELTADRAEPDAGTRGTGSFFTRGVDSWYTALTYGDRAYDAPPLTHLVYVPTIDFMFDAEHRARAIADTEAAARSVDATPVVVETNLREHTERFLHWGYYHGAGLSSVGLALGLERMLLPGARSYGRLEPEGSHPLLDPLWSTARTQVVHHGAEATRWAKVERVATEPRALRTLKVCFAENTNGNCGRCPKCLVTMVMLAAVGKLDECPFDEPLHPIAVARLRGLPDSLVQQLADEVLPEVGDGRLALALRSVIVRTRLNTLGQAMLEASRAILRLQPPDRSSPWR